MCVRDRFVARTFASKARTMSFTFGTLSMLILTSLLALNYSSINKASYDISVNLNAPYDIQPVSYTHLDVYKRQNVYGIISG